MPEKKRNTLSFLLPWILTLIFIVGIVYSCNTDTKVKKFDNFEALVSKIENDKTDDTYEFKSINRKLLDTSREKVYGTIKEGDEEYSYSFTFYCNNNDRSQRLTNAIEASDLRDIAINPNKGDIWMNLLIFVAPTLLLIIFGLIIVGRLSAAANGGGGGGSARSSFDFGKSKARLEEAPKVRFSDVAGCDEEKAEMEELVDYLKKPKKYAAMGARIPKGAILKGPPGTGKTLLAKAVAGEAGVPFYSISGSDFVEMFVGVGASRVRDMFARAKATAPCIIFIDEIDAVGRQRGAGFGGGHDEREQTLNQLLVEMDGFESNAGILVIAATNRPDVLDPALLRAGRFDRQIIIPLPDRKGREAILGVHARNKKLASDVNLENLARRTPGFSGADLENVLNEAAILAVREGKEEIDMVDMDEAIDRVMSGPAKKSRIITDKEKKLVAYHESGHALIGMKIPAANVVQKVTIIPRGDAGGYVLMTPEEDQNLQTKSELLAKITSYLAGRVSEEIFFGDVTTGAQSDIQEATRIARLMVTELGMSRLGPVQYETNTGSVFLGRDYANTAKNFSGQVAYEIDKEVREIINECYEVARKTIEEHKETLILIAETLIEKEILTREEIKSLVEEGHLPGEGKDKPTKRTRKAKATEENKE